MILKSLAIFFKIHEWWHSSFNERYRKALFEHQEISKFEKLVLLTVQDRHQIWYSCYVTTWQHFALVDFCWVLLGLSTHNSSQYGQEKTDLRFSRRWRSNKNVSDANVIRKVGQQLTAPVMLIISSLSQVKDTFRCGLEKCTGSHVVGIRSLKVSKKRKRDGFLG